MKVKDSEMLAEVRSRVAAIRACSDDDERAHGLEDDLYEFVLRLVAAGQADSRALAKEALRTKRLRFARWTS